MSIKKQKSSPMSFNPSMVNSMPFLSYQRIKEIMGSPLLFIVFSFLYPTVFLLEAYGHKYTVEQIIATLIFVLLVAIITAVTGGICVRYFVKLILLVANKCGLETDITPVTLKLYRAFLGGGGTIIILVLLYPEMRELFPKVFNNMRWLAPSYLIMALGISILTYRFGLKLFNYMLCGLILANCALGVLDNLRGESLKFYTQKKQQEVIFKQKPNVYLVILESYASLDLRQETFGIDNAPLTQELKEKNYDIYKIYANYSHSLASIASVMMMDHHYYRPDRGFNDGEGYRKIICGAVSNPVITTFANNGYRFNYTRIDPYLYYRSPFTSLPLLEPIHIFEGFFSLARRTLRIELWQSELFQSLLWLPDRITEKFIKPLKTGKMANDQMPVFSVISAGAAHALNAFSQYPPEIRSLPDADSMPLWKLNRVNNYWVTSYKSIVAKSDTALIERIRYLAVKDPTAVIILLGDHGTYYNRFCWFGEKNDLNENMLAQGFQPAEVTRDSFEVFMAIKWPHGTEKPREYFSHVNLFRNVFAILAKDDSILKTQVSNNSFILATNKATSHFGKIERLFYTVKDGKVLDRWEPLKSFSTDQVLD